VKKKKKKRNKRSRDFCFLTLFIVTGFLFILPACGDDKPKSQEKKIGAASEKTKKKSVNEAVTDKKESHKEVVKYHYDPMGKKDPFKPLIKEGEIISGSILGGAPLTPLQKYTLAELKLVAIITGTENPGAMVEDSKGDGYIIKKGTLIGDRYGEVVEIERNEVVILEKEIDQSSGEIVYSKVSLILHKSEEEEL
jgi:type IV pilus assembly protein PilP